MERWHFAATAQQGNNACDHSGMEADEEFAALQRQ